MRCSRAHMIKLACIGVSVGFDDMDCHSLLHIMPRYIHHMRARKFLLFDLTYINLMSSMHVSSYMIHTPR
jgi:hypothetical protein